MQFYNYGTTDPIPVVISLNGIGVNATLAAGDVRLIKDGVAAGNVNALPVAVDGTNYPGDFTWTPTAAETQCEYFVLVIKDQTSPIAFNENRITHYTGGNGAARLKG